jgi:molybdenum cofactor biosynthesis enzyme MoaA
MPENSLEFEDYAELEPEDLEDLEELEAEEEPLSDEEKKKIESIIDVLIAAYITILFKANLETRLSGSFYALKEVNRARTKAGLKPINIDADTIKKEALKGAEEYKKLLQEKGGSYVVVKKNGTETLEFKAWLKDLRDDTKEKVINIFDDAVTNGWSSDQLKSELGKVEELLTNKRAKAAAFSETRVNEYLVRMKTWKYGKVATVQRHVNSSNPCATCEGMDGEVYEIGSQPPLSHLNCLCSYSIYSFEDTK